MRISDWSSDVCSSDLLFEDHREYMPRERRIGVGLALRPARARCLAIDRVGQHRGDGIAAGVGQVQEMPHQPLRSRSEEHTSELQSLMRISYAVFCLKKKKTKNTKLNINIHTR